MDFYLQFNGSNQLATFSSLSMELPAGINVGMSVVTMMRWTRKQGAGDFDYFLSTGPIGDDNLQLFVTNNVNPITVTANLGSSSSVSAPADFEDKWYLVVWARESTNTFIYFCPAGGGPVTGGYNVQNSSVIPGSKTWHVGTRGDLNSQRFAKVDVDWFAKYSRRLTVQEIESLATGAVGPAEVQNCDVFFPINEGTGTTSASTLPLPPAIMTMFNMPTDGSQWGVYGEVEPPGGTTYDAGGVSSFNISAQGGATATMAAGGVSALTVTGAGGVSVTHNAGGVSSLSVVATGGAAATMAAGGASEFTIISTGGAVVENDITGGGLSSFSISGQGGATVTRNAGGIAYFSVAAGGGASVGVAAGGATEFNIVAAGGVSAILSAGGVSSFNVSGQGGAAVNEQAIVINRVTFASAAMPQAVTLSTMPVLESTIIPVQFNYRRVL